MIENGQLQGVFPVFIGDQVSGNLYSDFLKNCDPSSSLVGNVVVDSIESKVSAMFLREGLGSLMKPKMSVRNILEFVKKEQGQSIGFDDSTRAERDYDKAIDVVVEGIATMVSDAKSRYDKKEGAKQALMPPPIGGKGRGGSVFDAAGEFEIICEKFGRDRIIVEFSNLSEIMEYAVGFLKMSDEAKALLTLKESLVTDLKLPPTKAQQLANLLKEIFKKM